MPLQNRVRPDGEIVADPSRGLMLGNRGCLHGQGRELGVSRWRSKLWIACVLDWRDWRRDPMPPSRWTALFFLDEVTALSAGHRPCAYCRRPDYLAFAETWRSAAHLDRPLRATEMDARLHAERTDRKRTKRTHPRPLADLPEGAMIRTESGPALLLAGQLRPWTFTGYGPPVPAPRTGQADVLTPPSIVAALTAGYRPLFHPSALDAPGPARWEEVPGYRGQLRRRPQP
jgi:hypothetical protein